MKQNFNALLNELFTVETIMTPTATLFTWPVEAGGNTLWTRPETAGYDLIPATRAGEISGLWRKGVETPAPLSHEWFISHNTAVPHVLRLFATKDSPGFLALYGQTIVGLVTPADLNKLPVRAYLYNLIGGLEVGLGRLLRDHFHGDIEGLLALLSPSSRGTVEAELAETKSGNVDVDPVEFLYISDLIDVVSKEATLRQMLGYPSRSQIEDDLGGIVSLRNRIMHPVRPFLENVPEDLAQQHGRIERARILLRKLDGLGPTRNRQGTTRLDN